MPQQVPAPDTEAGASEPDIQAGKKAPGKEAGAACSSDKQAEPDSDRRAAYCSGMSSGVQAGEQAEAQAGVQAAEPVVVPVAVPAAEQDEEPAAARAVIPISSEHQKHRPFLQNESA